MPYSCLARLVQNIVLSYKYTLSYQTADDNNTTPPPQKA
jgi:hypothetical protein